MDNIPYFTLNIVSLATVSQSTVWQMLNDKVYKVSQYILFEVVHHVNRD